MANAYIAGKWSGTLSANLKGDASKTTPTLGDDFDSELNNLKKLLLSGEKKKEEKANGRKAN